MAKKKVKKAKVAKKEDKKPVYNTIRQMMRGEGITREEAMKRQDELHTGAYSKSLE